MREYSNAFKDDYRYDKLIEILNSGVVYYGFQECEFVRKIRNKYGLNVVFTDFAIGQHQTSLSVYFDFLENDNDLNKSLREEFQKHEIFRWPIGNELYDLRVKKFSETLINEYLESFHYKQNDLPEIVLYGYDFISICQHHTIVDARPKIHKMITEKYPKYHVQLMYSRKPKLIILFPYTSDFNKFRLLVNSRIFKAQCYQIIKEFDTFNCMTEDNFVLEIYDKNKITPQDLNVDFRDWGTDFQ